MKRPKPASVGPVQVSVVRGPRDDGRWYWRGRVSEAGKQRTVWTGWATSAEAVRACAGVVSGAPGTPGDTTADTVREVLGYWRASQEGSTALSPHTISAIRGRTPHLTRLMGHIGVDRVTRATLETYRDARIREGAAPRTVGLEFGYLRQAWRWAYEARLHDERPLPSVRIVPRDVRSRYTPTRVELARVLAQLDGWARLATLLYASTGARLREVAALRWGAVDLEAGVARLSGKTGPRPVPLPRPIVEALRPLVGDPDDFVLGREVSTVTSGYGRALTKACAAAEVPRFSPHGLRRHVTDLILGAGVSIEIEAKMLGHSPQVSRRRYLGLKEDEHRVAARMARLGYGLEEGETVIEFPPR